MRVAIITVGSTGDIYPYVALGQGLHAAGFQVRIVTHANAERVVRSRGLDFFPVKGDPREIMKSDSGQALLNTGENPITFMRRFVQTGVELMSAVIAECWDACRGTDVILLSATGLVFGYHIAEKLGVPYYLALLQPIYYTRAFPSVFFPPWPEWIPVGRGEYNRLTHSLTAPLLWQFIRAPTNQARREILNLPPLSIRGPFQEFYTRGYPVLFGYSPTVLPKPSDWPDWSHVTGFWALDTATNWQPPDELVEFLDSGPPPVYIGFGSMASSKAAEMTHLVSEALKATQQRGILLTGWGGLNRSNGNRDLFHIESVPHDWLFPRVAAVVHHGGVGTTANGLRAGVPSIVIPFFADQAFWGQRVYELGVGTKPIPRSRLTVERLAEAIRLATSDQEVRRRAAALGKRLVAEDGVGNAVQVLMTTGAFGFSNSAAREPGRTATVSRAARQGSCRDP